MVSLVSLGKTRATYATGESVNERCDSLGGVGGHLAVAVYHIGDRVDDGGSHDDAVGGCANGPRLLGRLDAEADTDRKIGMCLDPGHGRCNVGGVWQRRSGNTRHRDVIDKAGGVLKHLGKTLVVGGG